MTTTTTTKKNKNANDRFIGFVEVLFALDVSTDISISTKTLGNMTGVSSQVDSDILNTSWFRCNLMKMLWYVASLHVAWFGKLISVN